MSVRVSDPFRILLAVSVAAALTVHSAVPSASAPSGFRYWSAAGDPVPPPATLSGTGLYLGTPGKGAKLIPEAWRYEVNVPQWSDDAVKRHWVILTPGRSIAFQEKDDYWGYPDSAVFVEELAIDTIEGDSTSRVLWETRILINKKDSTLSGLIADFWYGYSYKWRKNQQDADLVDRTHGKDDSIRIWSSAAKGDRKAAFKKWHFPTVYQCLACHRTGQADTVHGRSLLGFLTSQLNRPAPDTVGMNQLDWFFSKQVLTGEKPASWDLSPRWRSIGDSGAGVDLRARSYIAANCSGCHGRRGIATYATNGVVLDFDFHAMQAAMEFRNARIGWDWGLDTVRPFFYKPGDPGNPTHGDSVPIVPALVVPGYPEKSALIFREKSRNTLPSDFDAIYNQMPPLATFEVNAPAVALLERWVREMANAPTAAGHGPRPGAWAIRMQGRILTLAPESGTDINPIPGNPEVSMVSVSGRRVDLRRLSARAYEAPAGLPKGLYYIRIGKRSVLRALF
jgi:hypothetical protein